MAETKRIHIPVSLGYDRQFLAMLQQFVDRIAAIGKVDDLSQSISDPPTQLEVQTIQTKINEILEAARGLD